MYNVNVPPYTGDLSIDWICSCFKIDPMPNEKIGYPLLRQNYSIKQDSTFLSTNDCRVDIKELLSCFSDF